MTKEDFMKMFDREKLKVLKEALDYISHDFQHQEIVEIDSIESDGDFPMITVWEIGVDMENWPRFTDYLHRKVTYILKDGEFELAEPE